MLHKKENQAQSSSVVIRQHAYGNNWSVFWLFICLDIYSKIIMIGDLRKDALQERVKNNNNQLFANIAKTSTHPQFNSLSWGLHKMTLPTPHYHCYHTNSMSAIPQMLPIRFWPNYKGFWYYSLKYSRCMYSELAAILWAKQTTMQAKRAYCSKIWRAAPIFC